MKLKFITYLTSILLLTGCASIDSSIITKKTTGNVPDIIVDDLSWYMVDNDFIVHASLVNNSLDTPKDVFYRCMFYDNKHKNINPNVSWNEALIYGSQSYGITCNSRNTSTNDFKIQIAPSAS